MGILVICKEPHTITLKKQTTMIRTAEEIMEEYILQCDAMKEGYASIEEMKKVPEWQVMLKAINQARKEVLEHAAEVANLQIQYGYGTLQHKGTTSFIYKDKAERTSYGHGDSGYEIVTPNKQSILNIINELK